MAERKQQLACYPDEELAHNIEDSADELGISVSKWLLEAAREKLQYEKVEE